MVDKVWIAWERQRRTLELSKVFGSDLYIFQSKGSRLTKYFKPLFKTIQVLIKTKPKILFVQNPSLFLALAAVIIKPFFGYKLIVDRHTNFKLKHRQSLNPKWILFQCLSNYTLKKADITIVTNKYLRLLVNSLGGTALVLQDKLPSIPINLNDKLDLPKFSALFICTYADDEPYKKVFNAVAKMHDIDIFVTGNIPSHIEQKSLRKNIHLLGFVSDETYLNYLASVDFVVVLTNQEFTLNCGSYEAVVMGKPMLLSNTKTIRDYFCEGAVYADPNSQASIEHSLDLMKKEFITLKHGITTAKQTLGESWEAQFEYCLQKIEDKI